MPKATTNLDDFFSEKNEVPSNWIKWGKVGDFIQGTFMSVEERDGKDYEGRPTRSKVYEFKVMSGHFHEMDPKKNPIEPGIEISAGELYFVGGKKGIDAQMRNAKVGEIIGIKFTEEIQGADKMKAPFKMIKVYNPHQMDPDFLGMNEAQEEKPDIFNM